MTPRRPTPTLFAPTLFLARMPGAAPAQVRARLDPGAVAVQGAAHVESHARHPRP